MRTSPLKGLLKKSPARHGTTDDFLHGRNGHNPDTMSSKHEDWHADKSKRKKKPVPKPEGGFMHPPYKKPVGPTEKPHYVHGYKKTKK